MNLNGLATAMSCRPGLPASPMGQQMVEQRRDPYSRQYQFRVRGHLGEFMMRSFADMELEIDGADTMLTAGALDRAALYAAVERIERLGLELLGIRPIVRDARTSLELPPVS